MFFFGDNNYHEIIPDTGRPAYNAPQFDTGKNYPVAYTKGTKMRVGAIIYVGAVSGQPAIQIRAKSDQGLDTGLVGAGWDKDHVVMPRTDSTVNLKPEDQITAYGTNGNGPFTINWSATIGGGPEKPIGTTTHTVYVTLHDPIKTASMGEFESVYALGCIYADGLGDGDEGSVVDTIYKNVFTTRSVQRVKPQSTDFDGKAMTYWQPGNDNNNDTAGLLKLGDGKCGAWASFFTDVLRTQGIDAKVMEIDPLPVTTKAVQSDLTKKYPNATTSYDPNTAGPPSRPNDATPLLYVKNWQIVDPFNPVRQDGIPAQGVNNNRPRAIFSNHWLVEYMFQYYDPSYGTQVVPANAVSWEDASLQGIGLVNVPVTGTGISTTIGSITIPQTKLDYWILPHRQGVQQTKSPFDTGY